MKAVKTKLAATNPDRVEAFEKGAQAFAKKIVSNFKDFEFVRLFRLQTMLLSLISGSHLQYTGESMNPEGMVVLQNYRVRCLILPIGHDIHISI